MPFRIRPEIPAPADPAAAAWAGFNERGGPRTFEPRRGALLTVFAISLACSLATAPATAVVNPQEGSRFEALSISDPSRQVMPERVSVEALPRGDGIRIGWEAFRRESGGFWEIHLDRRSGAPLLVQGSGIPWEERLEEAAVERPSGRSLDNLDASLRAFMRRHAAILRAKDEELVLDRASSGQLTDETWQVVYTRRVDGIPVLGDRYLFTVGHGSLVAFGATRWGAVPSGVAPVVEPEELMPLLGSYLTLGQDDAIEVLEPAKLAFVPVAAGSEASRAAAVGHGGSAAPARYAGALGAGYRAVLAWRMVVRIGNDPETWVVLADARTGALLSLYDDNQYARAKGGVYPVSNDQNCPDGCEQPGYPMPHADISIGGALQSTSAMGLFSCQQGTATTTLAGSYVRVIDGCGPIAESIPCEADLDLGSGPGTDCAVPAGSSSGNTKAARSSFYHLNRISAKARAWLPTNAWLSQQLVDNVNVPGICNAYWGANAVNFYRSSTSCRNAGEIAGIFLHEWGHGLDQNDGGGYDNPTEAYADVVSFLQTHVSCIGRGFYKLNSCSGYGNVCLNCTGVRDVDWNQRANHVPSTPAGFLATNCSSGTGPCGKQQHCESYVATETIYDLATRDLPAAGYDQNTAWQITDRLWYKSRPGSGGNAYTCSGTTANGCAAGSWFTKLRVVDDDDGNLANGTPHAAAIFAAFDRHGIACGTATDPSNRSTTSCPSLASPSVTATASSQTVSLSWTPVAGAASYRVLRNDAGCAAGYAIVATVPGTSYVDPGLANGFTEYYTVQAVGSNSACEGTLSACRAVTPAGPHARYSGHTLLQDTCSSGGAGSGDGTRDSGERLHLRVTLINDGTVPLTGVSAVLTSTTPGVVIVNGTSVYGSIAPGAMVASPPPEFTVVVPASAACGSSVTFQLAVSSGQGSWTSTFVEKLGMVSSVAATALDEGFNAGIPAGWTVLDGGVGGGSAASWTTANPGGRILYAPMLGPAPTVDSDRAGTSALQDEQLMTPALDLSGALGVTLQFDQYFRWYNLGLDERGDVDVRSSRTGGAWVNVFRNQGAISPNPDHHVVDITAQAAGATGVQVRFHYYNASYEWFWQVDNVKIATTLPAGCVMTACTPSSSPPPVPDGSFGAAMRASRVGTGGASIDLTWDAGTCAARGYHLLYGPLAGVSSYQVSGSVCAIGTMGTRRWSGVPAGNLWFVVVSDDGLVEGSWGHSSSGIERRGSAPSGRCGTTVRDNSGICVP